MEIDARVQRHYEQFDEDGRLWEPGLGDLTRLRTWDIFDRHLPPAGRVADIGGGPGTHAAYLARQGHDVVMFDPVPRHVDAAAARSAAQPAAPFTAKLAEARQIPLDDSTVDTVVLMGPLYHLGERDERLAALREAARVLRPDGLLVTEIITRYAWVLGATRLEVLDRPGTWDDLDTIVRTGTSPDRPAGSGFWAYYHRPDDLSVELDGAGYIDIRLVAVEGFAWLLPDLDRRLADPADLLAAVRITESEPSLLGASAHVIGLARKAAAPAPGAD
jgi:SAM-dependent methyltransferase